jgi:hypothetical protein
MAAIARGFRAVGSGAQGRHALSAVQAAKDAAQRQKFGNPTLSSAMAQAS